MKKVAATNKCTSIMGHFNDRYNAPVKCRAHCPMQLAQGYLRRHWMLPSGKYLPHIARADALVIDFGGNNRIVVL